MKRIAAAERHQNVATAEGRGKDLSWKTYFAGCALSRLHSQPLIFLNRHRGGGCPPTPATPPCVRVRTRRFEKVMNLTPREQRRKAASAKVRIRKRNRQGLRMGQMPGATAAGGSFLRECAAHAQLKQHRPAAALGFPVPPQRSPKSQSNPASQLDQQIGRFAEPKIAAPAPHIGS